MPAAEYSPYAAEMTSLQPVAPAPSADEIRKGAAAAAGATAAAINDESKSSITMVTEAKPMAVLKSSLYNYKCCGFSFCPCGTQKTEYHAT